MISNRKLRLCIASNVRERAKEGKHFIRDNQKRTVQRNKKQQNVERRTDMFTMEHRVCHEWFMRYDAFGHPYRPTSVRNIFRLDYGSASKISSRNWIRQKTISWCIVHQLRAYAQRKAIVPASLCNLWAFSKYFLSCFLCSPSN